MNTFKYTKGKGHIIFVTNNKGGVAKTTLTAHLSDYLTTLNKNHLLVDIDMSGHALKRYKPNTIVLNFDETKILSGESDLDRLFDLASSGNTVLVDTGANAGKGLMSWMKDVDFLELTRDYEVVVSFIIPINSEDKDTLHYLLELNDFAQNFCNVVICKSELHGTQFSSAEATLKEKNINLPNFKFPEIPKKFTIMFKEKDLTLTSALQQPDLPILDKNRLQRRLKEMHSSFNEISGLFDIE